MKPLFLLSVLLVCLAWVYPQSKKKHVTTEIHFSQVWVWEYVNTFFEEDTPQYRGELVVYFNPENNYWLFTQEAYGFTDEMTLWTLGMPDGKYISCYLDEHGNQKQYTDKIEVKPQTSIPKQYVPLQNKKEFKAGESGILDFTAQEYQLEYIKSNQIECLYLAETEIDFSPIYHFNRRDVEAKLPIHFPVDLPATIKVLESYTIYSKTVHIKFKEQGHTTYFIEIEKMD